jgi:hypothetical protein
MSAWRTFSKAALALVLLGAALALPPAQAAVRPVCLNCVSLQSACGTGTPTCVDGEEAAIAHCIGGFAPNYQATCENQGGTFNSQTVGGVIDRSCGKECL